MMETMGKPDKDLNEVMKHICDAVQKRIDEAYKRGINDGSLDVKQRAEGAYQRGLEEGKKATLGLVADASNAEYQRGLEDGKHTAVGAAELREKLEYQRGLDDAWEAAKKISLMTSDEIEKVFPGAAKYNRYNLGYSGVEAIDKLKAYEEKQKADDEIKVGDELEHTVSGYTSKAIFLEKIGDDEDWYKCLFWTGCGVAILSYPKSQFKRTGKHYDIDKILEAMRT